VPGAFITTIDVLMASRQIPAWLAVRLMKKAFPSQRRLKRHPARKHSWRLSWRGLQLALKLALSGERRRSLRPRCWLLCKLSALSISAKPSALWHGGNLIFGGLSSALNGAQWRSSNG